MTPQAGRSRRCVMHCAQSADRSVVIATATGARCNCRCWRQIVQTANDCVYDIGSEWRAALNVTVILADCNTQYKKIKADRPLMYDTLNAPWLLTDNSNGLIMVIRNYHWLNSASRVLISTCSVPLVQVGERKQFSLRASRTLRVVT